MYQDIIVDFVVCDVVVYAIIDCKSCHEFESWSDHTSFAEINYELISMTFLSLPLIQVGLFSVFSLQFNFNDSNRLGTIKIVLAKGNSSHPVWIMHRMT